MTSSQPLISVVIPTRNRVQYIGNCLKSVFAEIDGDYPNVEVIVIDGASTDGSVDVIKSHADRLAYWVSEPDSGVSDALNKGVTRAQGEFIRVLGADDLLNPGWFSKMVDYMERRPELEVLIGHADFYVEEENGTANRVDILQPLGALKLADFLKIGDIGWPSPEVALTRKKAYDRIGGYDTRFHYLAYLDFWLRACLSGSQCEAVPFLNTKRYLTPSSDTRSGTSVQINNELRSVIRKYARFSWFVRSDEAVKIGILKSAVKTAYRAGWYFDIHPVGALRRVWERRQTADRP